MGPNLKRGTFGASDQAAFRALNQGLLLAKVRDRLEMDRDPYQVRGQDEAYWGNDLEELRETDRALNLGLDAYEVEMVNQALKTRAQVVLK